MRIDEISKENELLARLRGIKVDSTEVYENLVKILTLITEDRFAPKRLITMLVNRTIPVLDDFESTMHEFLDDVTFDTSDPDILKLKSVALGQLHHIRSLRKDAGI